MKSFSPGLARSDYPGSTVQKHFQPHRGCIRIRRKLIQPRWGCFIFDSPPSVAAIASRQRRAE
jgi:hypothetical protein